MKSSRIEYIKNYRSDYDYIEGLINLIDSKKSIYRSNLPEFIKNMALSGIKNVEFKTSLRNELILRRNSTFEAGIYDNRKTNAENFYPDSADSFKESHA